MICPKCGDELSSAVKVCPRCGYVVDDKMDEYLDTLESLLLDLKTLPKESFSSYFSAQAYLMTAFVMIVFLIVYFMTGGLLFLLLAAIALILTVIYLIKKIVKGKSHASSEARYKETLASLETMVRLLKSDYGEAREVRDRLRSVTSELKDITYAHNANHRNALKTWIAVVVVVVALVVAGITLLGMRDLDNAQVENTVTMS